MPQIDHLYERAKRMFNGKEGIKIKTIKLKGQISQGLALPISSFFQMFADSKFDEGQELCEYFFEGNDVSDLIGVEKWEAAIPGQLGGQVKGNFPGFIQKTDQERCQNLGAEIFRYSANSRYEITMKLDGTSFTGFHNNGEDGVCGRNWQLDINEQNANNSLVRMYIDSNLQAVLREFGRNYAIQGELMGPGIQKNREGLKQHQLYIFDIFDIDDMRYLTPHARLHVMTQLYDYGLDPKMVHHVPVLGYDQSLEELGITNTQELLKYAEGPSLNHPIREGLVFKKMDGEFSFKAISNKFLLKEED